MERLSKNTLLIVVSYLPRTKIPKDNYFETSWYYKIRRFFNVRMPEFIQGPKDFWREAHKALVKYEGIHQSLYVFYSESLKGPEKFLEWALGKIIKSKLHTKGTPDYEGHYWTWMFHDAIEVSKEESYKIVLKLFPRSFLINESREIFYLILKYFETFTNESPSKILSRYQIFLQVINPPPEKFYYEDGEDYELDYNPRAHEKNIKVVLHESEERGFLLVEKYLLEVLREKNLIEPASED